jgi:hypothetical protein
MSYPSRAIALVFLSIAIGMLQGCAGLGFIGAMSESYKRSSKRWVEAEYTGLEEKSWAVAVSASRGIQGEFPDVVPWMTHKSAERLVANQAIIGASSYVPADKVLRYQYENPRWVAMPKGELARALGVQRLIFVELVEYRLSEPGNQYLWAGLATGTVNVYEADGPAPDEIAFQKPIRVGFPDKLGFGPGDIHASVVATALGTRFLDRVTWLFYRHEEPYYPDY